MKKRNLVSESLTTKSGTPLSTSTGFDDRATTSRLIEEARNKGDEYVTLVAQGFYKGTELIRTHENGEAIIETWQGQDVRGNTHILYLRWKPTTQLLEMRNNS